MRNYICAKLRGAHPADFKKLIWCFWKSLTLWKYNKSLVYVVLHYRDLIQNGGIVELCTGVDLGNYSMNTLVNTCGRQYTCIWLLFSCMSFESECRTIVLWMKCRAIQFYSILYNIFFRLYMLEKWGKGQT